MQFLVHVIKETVLISISLICIRMSEYLIDE